MNDLLLIIITLYTPPQNTKYRVCDTDLQNSISIVLFKLESLFDSSTQKKFIIFNGDVNFSHTDWNKLSSSDEYKKSVLKEVIALKLCSISSGGPQGSRFAVFLFLVYINDLPGQLINKTFLYADDTKTIGQISELEDLQFDINRAINWSGLNKLNFSFDKSAFSSYHTKVHMNRPQIYLQNALPFKTKNKLKTYC